VSSSLPMHDLHAWTDRDLAWLWQALADAADRRGDPTLADGKIKIVLSTDPAERAAASGLIPPGRPGSKVTVDLGELSTVVGHRAPGVTLGEVVATLTGRTLATKALEKAAKADHRAKVEDTIRTACEQAGIGDLDLLTTGRGRHAVTRFLNAAGDTAIETARNAVSIAATILRLPDGERVDRRFLVPGNPHALDEGPLPNLVLAMLTSAGRVSTEGPTRQRWEQAGVDFDDIMGGLAMTGVLPTGWSAPLGAIVTIPPRELARAEWAPTSAHNPIFVTENPSILAAAADMAEAESLDHVRVVCTLGTPSGNELAALARLAGQGWRLIGRFDFDPAGINHTNAFLDQVPGATTWRMAATDYDHLTATVPFTGKLSPTPWDPKLHERMTSTGMAAFEEDLIDPVLNALRTGFALEHPQGPLK